MGKAARRENALRDKDLFYAHIRDRLVSEMRSVLTLKDKRSPFAKAKPSKGGWSPCPMVRKSDKSQRRRGEGPGGGDQSRSTEWSREWYNSGFAAWWDLCR